MNMNLQSNFENPDLATTPFAHVHRHPVSSLRHEGVATALLLLPVAAVVVDELLPVQIHKGAWQKLGAKRLHER